jgi:hypothetical protein
MWHGQNQNNYTFDVRLFNGVLSYPHPLELVVNGTAVYNLSSASMGEYYSFNISGSTVSPIQTFTTTLAVRDAITKKVTVVFPHRIYFAYLLFDQMIGTEQSVTITLGDLPKYALTLWAAGQLSDDGENSTDVLSKKETT